MSPKEMFGIENCQHMGHLVLKDTRAARRGGAGVGRLVRTPWVKPLDPPPRCSRLSLWQEVQMMPGRMQRTSQRKTVLFGQCHIVMGWADVGVGSLTNGGPFYTDSDSSLVQVSGLAPFLPLLSHNTGLLKFIMWLHTKTDFIKYMSTQAQIRIPEIMCVCL